jgi:hypothetical protein
MDSFEQVVAGLLFREGYWVTQGFKVDLTKKEKARIKRPSCPRWEIDLLAFKGSTSELLAVECKSYLDSYGVRASEIISQPISKSRYKLFVDKTLRDTVLRRLSIQIHELGLTSSRVKPRLALAAGKIYSNDTKKLEQHFSKHGWKLFNVSWLSEKLKLRSEDSYQDSVADVVSKLIFRNTAEQAAAPTSPDVSR